MPSLPPLRCPSLVLTPYALHVFPLDPPDPFQRSVVSRVRAPRGARPRPSSERPQCVRGRMKFAKLLAETIEGTGPGLFGDVPPPRIDPDSHWLSYKTLKKLLKGKSTAEGAEEVGEQEVPVASSGAEGTSSLALQRRFVAALTRDCHRLNEYYMVRWWSRD